MKIKLRQAFDLQMGKTPARNRPDYWSGDRKWISIADIGNTGKYITDTKESITEAGIEGSGIKVVPQGTVIMSFKLSIGKTAITSEDMYTNEAIMAFIDNGKFAVDTDYLYHLCCGTNWTAGTNKAVMGLTLNKATLLEKEIPLPDINEQHEIANKLDKIDAIIAERQQQLALIDQAVKSRFIELFGDPVRNSMGLKTMPLGKACCLKAGITTSADMIHEQSNEFSVPCYGGNGIRGYVESATQCGCYPIIGRQGALCGNVQLATGKFHATEHAVLVTPLIKANVVWLFYLLKMMDLYRFHTGAAQPGLAVKILNTVDIPIADVAVQHQFAAFVKQTDKSKLAVQKGLQELEILKKSLMQQYFG